MRTLKGPFNAATTSTKTPPAILSEIERVLRANVLLFERHGYVVTAWSDPSKTLQSFRMEFEVCRIPLMGMYGVRLKRITGDVWHYKSVCEVLVGQMRL